MRVIEFRISLKCKISISVMASDYSPLNSALNSVKVSQNIQGNCEASSSWTIYTLHHYVKQTQCSKSLNF